ncbi:MAG TPA: LLM class F420-dependent oxidoreductase [Microlunatus sp.]|nr:LLM class F420-dependent oxidoreductase [Microlunatus sp.]
MKLAIHLADLSYPGGPAALLPTLTTLARTADQGGVSRITMMDHYFQMEPYGGPPEPMLEGYTSLGYLAGQTTSAELGLLVTGVTYRHPGLLAKIITTLDVLSSGRAVLGLGAAWYEREHRGLGVPFPSTAERFERLEETLQIVAQMWSEDDGPYQGKHYRLAETVCVPAPVRRPPIMIGGQGERKTLRLVARYADACNLFPADEPTVRHKLAVLDDHCATAGRDPAEVARTIFAAADPVADPDAFRAEVEMLTGLGISMVWTGPPRGISDPVGWVAELCERRLPELCDL